MTNVLSGTTFQQNRRNEARNREANRKALSPEEQLARLDARLGEGQGAHRERGRLGAQIMGTTPTKRKNKS